MLYQTPLNHLEICLQSFEHSKRYYLLKLVVAFDSACGWLSSKLLPLRLPRNLHVLASDAPHPGSTCTTITSPLILSVDTFLLQLLQHVRERDPR
jgi:hypothetical protein